MRCDTCLKMSRSCVHAYYILCICDHVRGFKESVLLSPVFSCVLVRLNNYRESRTVQFILQELKQTFAQKKRKRYRPLFGFTHKRMDDHCSCSIFGIPINPYRSGLQYISRVIWSVSKFYQRTVKIHFHF